MDLNRSDLFGGIGGEVPNVESLTSESVEGTSLAFQGIDDIHGGDSLPLGMLGVGDGITDDVLKEDLEDTTGLFVDEARDTLDTTTTRQTADGGLGDTLDVITQHLPVTLGASLSEPLASFASSCHCCECGRYAFANNYRPLYRTPADIHYTSLLPLAVLTLQSAVASRWLVL